MTYAPSYGFSYYKQVGTSPIEAWYHSGGTKTSPTANTAGTIDRLEACPFVCERGGTIDRLAFRVTTGGTAGSVARVGIYTNTGDNNPQPNALVVDGGEFDTTTTGVKSATISNVLAPGLYWFVFHAGVAAPTIRGWGVAALNNTILGISAVSGWDSVFRVTKAYAALPDPFTAGGGWQRGVTAPAIAVRFSA